MGFILVAISSCLPNSAYLPNYSLPNFNKKALHLPEELFYIVFVSVSLSDCHSFKLGYFHLSTY